MPIGTATSIAIRLVIRVALTRGMIPNLPIAGCHSVVVRNIDRFTSSLRKNRIDSRPSTMTMPTVTKIDNAPQKNSRA